jgi:hypothetical protein
MQVDGQLGLPQASGGWKWPLQRTGPLLKYCRRRFAFDFLGLTRCGHDIADRALRPDLCLAGAQLIIGRSIALV